MSGDANILHDRIRRAYAVAFLAQRDGGRVEIHLGSNVVDHLRAMAAVPTPPAGAIQTAWGFPVIPVDNNPAHIAVHVVHDIF